MNPSGFRSEAPDKAPPRVNAFFALQPPGEVRAALAALAVQLAGQTGGRAVSAANLHLTVAFIGMIDRARLAALRAVGELARAGVAPFRLRLDRIGRFARARVAWAGVSVLPPELLRLHDELGEGCRSAGLASDSRHYSPHVTLVRKAIREPADPMPEPLALEFEVGGFELLHTVTTPQGVAYRTVDAFIFGAPARR